MKNAGTKFALLCGTPSRRFAQLHANRLPTDLPASVLTHATNTSVGQLLLLFISCTYVSRRRRHSDRVGVNYSIGFMQSGSKITRSGECNPVNLDTVAKFTFAVRPPHFYPAAQLLYARHLAKALGVASSPSSRNRGESKQYSKTYFIIHRHPRRLNSVCLPLLGGGSRRPERDDRRV